MDNRRHDCRWVTQWFVLCVSLLVPPAALAFEGDYIWEARFKASQAKAEKTQKAADQYALAEMYFHGRGTVADPAKALRWFLRAAKQGHMKAAYRAGYLYLHTDGLPPDAAPIKAMPWLRKAASAGYAPAQYELGKVYYSGDIVQRDASRALKWLGKAKRAGYAPASLAFAKTVKRLVSKSAGKLPRRQPPKKKTNLAQQVVADTSGPKGIILQSKWGSVEGPSRFLPSRLTRCREHGDAIECVSAKQGLQLANSRVEYRTSARITDINAEGHFRLTFANNLLTGEKGVVQAALKTGWRHKEQVLDCSLIAGRTISCAQGDDKQYQFFGHY